MALTKSYTFEEGVDGAAPAAGGDYLTGPVGSVVYSTAAALHGALGLRCVNGGYLPLVTGTPDTGAFRISFIPRTVTTGVPRIITLMDGANSFIGMFRCHTDGKFDLANGSSTRVASSVASWVAGTPYWAEGTLSGTGTARTMQVKVYSYASGLVWDSGAVAVTASTSGAWARARAGAQGGTTGGIDVDQVAFFDTVAFPGPIPTGTITGNLPSLTGSLTGRARAAAAAVGSLPALVGSLVGRATDRGTAAGPLPALTGSFAGTVTAEPISAGLAGVLPALTGMVTGTVTAAGAALQLDLEAGIEPDRYRTAVEPDRYAGRVERDRYTGGVEA